MSVSRWMGVKHELNSRAKTVLLGSWLISHGIPSGKSIGGVCRLMRGGLGALRLLLLPALLLIALGGPLRCGDGDLRRLAAPLFDR